MAAYLVTLAVGRYRKVTAAGPRDLPLTYWVRPRTDDKALTVLKKSPKILSWLEERYGPYPFPSGGAVLVPSKSAMETQQMVTIGAPAKGFAQYTQVLWDQEVYKFSDEVLVDTWLDARTTPR